MTLLSEYEIQCQIREWLSLQHPKVLMRCDLGGIRLPIGLARKVKRLNPYRAWPDIFIAEPRTLTAANRVHKGQYQGLFIELKRCYSDLYTKNGEYRKTQHIQEQKEMLTLLLIKGYKAVFSCGFEDTRKAIDSYLKGEDF